MDLNPATAPTHRRVSQMEQALIKQEGTNMVEVTAALVKDLRQRTGAGMMDCKRALIETGGDIEEGIDWLRKKGLAAAAKKGGRVTADGLVGVCIENGRGALVEVNTETDFVSRNPEFQAFVATVAQLALKTDGDLEALKAAPYPDAGRTVEEQLTHLIATMGENMNLRRVAVLAVQPGVIGAYIHNALSPAVGKIGVIIAVQSDAPAKDLEPIAKQLAMHIAASSPVAVSRDEVDTRLLDRERAVLAEQARATGKAEAIIEKMVEGRLRRYYEEVCLLEQTFVIDGESKVADVLDRLAKEIGEPLKVTAFQQFVLGEGLEKREEDFAAEVAKTAGG
jgi:elongation factor Ts